MKRGIIKFYNKEKGYGFMLPDGGGADLFFHVSGIGHIGYIPEKDDFVYYNEGQSKGKVCAIDIVPV